MNDNIMMSVLNNNDLINSNNNFYSLGNVLLSNSSDLQNQLIRNTIIKETMLSNEKLLIVSENSDRYFSDGLIENGFAYLSVNSNNRINPFFNKGKNYIKDFIFATLEKYKKIEKNDAILIERYILVMLKIIEQSNIDFRFADLLSYDIDYLLELNEKIVDDQRSKDRNSRFLNEMYSDYMKIESYFELLNDCGIGEFISGDVGFSKLVKKSKVTAISLREKNRTGNVEKIFYDIVTKSLFEMIEDHFDTSRITIFIEDSRLLEYEDLAKICNLCTADNLTLIISVNDVAMCIGKIGNIIIDNMDTFFVFAQSSNENCNYWSEFFGEYEMTEVNYSYEKRKSKGLFGSVLNSGGVISRRTDYQVNGYSTHRVKKPRYKPEMLRKLNQDEAIVYSKISNMTKRITIIN